MTYVPIPYVIEQTGRIERSYDLRLRQYEYVAIGHLSDIPVPQSGEDTVRESNRRIEFSLPEMVADTELVNMLEHIAYHTQVGIEMKRLFIVPKAESLIELIEAELGRLARQG